MIELGPLEDVGMRSQDQGGPRVYGRPRVAHLPLRHRAAPLDPRMEEHDDDVGAFLGGAHVRIYPGAVGQARPGLSPSATHELVANFVRPSTGTST